MLHSLEFANELADEDCPSGNHGLGLHVSIPSQG